MTSFLTVSVRLLGSRIHRSARFTAFGIRGAARMDAYRPPSTLERDCGMQRVASSSVTLDFSDPVDDSLAYRR